MENTAIMVLAIVGIAFISWYVPLVGLVAMAWGAYRWVGLYGALVITLFWVRYGSGPLLVWPPWPAAKP